MTFFQSSISCPPLRFGKLIGISSVFIPFQLFLRLFPKSFDSLKALLSLPDIYAIHNAHGETKRVELERGNYLPSPSLPPWAFQTSSTKVDRTTTNVLILQFLQPQF